MTIVSGRSVPNDGLSQLIAQAVARGNKRSSANLDATVPQQLFKSAKLMGQVAQAVGTATNAARKRPTLDILGGDCQESFCTIRRKEVPKALQSTLKAIPQRMLNHSDSGQVAIRDGATEFFEITPFLTQGDVRQLPTDLGGVDSNNRMVYIGGGMELLLTNHSGGTQFCKLYILIPRIANNKGPTNAFSEGTATLTSIADSHTHFGMRPGDSPYFRDLFRVYKVITFCLSPGQSHKHFFKYDVDKILDDITESYEFIAGWLPEWTVSFVLQCHGIAATSATGGDTTTTAGGQINYIWVKRHRAKFFSLDEGEDIFLSTLLPTKGSVTERVYQPETNAPEAVNTGD